MIVSDNWLKSVYSDGSKYFVSNPLPVKGETVSISIQLAESAPVTAVFLMGKKNGVAFPLKMELIRTENSLKTYKADVTIWEKEYSYYFIISSSEGNFYYNQEGIFDFVPDSARNFIILTDYVQPQWVKNAVFYQIFPERFCNGDPSISVKDNEYSFDGHPAVQVKDWNAAPEDFDKAFCMDFYGGDLIGIKQKIPYLKKLGVTALYLNPIFYGATVHKYDCLDYFHVDPHFGGDEALKALVEELHANGMKIILDVSINHTGIANRWFNRDCTFFPKSEGAYNNPDSPERGYYFFDEKGNYKSWFNVSSLPTLNYQSEALKKRLYLDKDSVVKKWLRKPYEIDGWRFDVADTMARNDAIQLHHSVWPEIRKSIKEENPQGYILAEDWTDCKEFLKGDEWDSPMNYYGSCRAIRGFYGQPDFYNGDIPELRAGAKKWTASAFAECIVKFQASLPFVIRQNLFNLLDSHDVCRFHNDPSITKDFVRGAAIMLFTLPGCTNIYYGDEAEIDGRMNSLEGCRYPMPWNKDIESTDSYKLYSALCHIKQSSEAFIDGGFRFLWVRDYVVAFARFTKNELWISIASSDKKNRKITLDMSIFGSNFDNFCCPRVDALGEKLFAKKKNGQLKLKIPAGKGYLVKILPAK